MAVDELETCLQTPWASTFVVAPLLTFVEFAKETSGAAEVMARASISMDKKVTMLVIRADQRRFFIII